MRINGFEQIKAFYSWVFNEPEKARPTHISLYLFLLNQNNRANWVEWFKCPYDLAMHGARIGNKGTYYRCLDDLKRWKIIDYKKGINNFKAPLIKLIQLYDNEHLTEQVSVPLSEHLSEPQCVPQTVPLPVPLTGNKYKLLTNNIKLITKYIDQVVKFVNEIELKNDPQKFYDNQIQKTTNEKYHAFVKYLFGENMLKKPLSGVLSITDQLTADEFEKVMEACERKNKKIGDMLTKIENDKKYYKGKTSLYRTLLNWVEDRFIK